MGWALCALAIVVIVGLARRWVPSDGPDLAGLGALGWRGEAGFVLLYVLAALFWLPASPLSMAAGVVWGAREGALLVWLAAVLAAQVTFYVSRRFRGVLRASLRGFPRGDRIDATLVGVHDGVTVALLRLSPWIPYNLLNVALGATSVSPRAHFAGTAVGIVPGVVLYVGAGAAVGGWLDGSRAETSSTAVWTMGVLATALAGRTLARRADAELAARGVLHVPR
jgi:uncharacterized membrane protein YdjX (TVP38/TMEM64 family)